MILLELLEERYYWIRTQKNDIVGYQQMNDFFFFLDGSQIKFNITKFIITKDF